MTPAERRLAALLPFVRDWLPPAPARVLEIGCGSSGGFVPALAGEGYAAVGVDPEAPAEPGYDRVTFEQYDVEQHVDAVVACTSLHHVDDVDRVLDRVAGILLPGGAVIVVEWAHECFDEPTARWCFDRLPNADDPEGWLPHHRAAWQASGQEWGRYLADFVQDEGLHAGEAVVRSLDARFERRLLARTPYFFPALANTTEADEQAAIDSGRIRANGIRYVGRHAAKPVATVAPG